jgi:hypothetical protein
MNVDPKLYRDEPDKTVLPHPAPVPNSQTMMGGDGVSLTNMSHEEAWAQSRARSVTMDEMARRLQTLEYAVSEAIRLTAPPLVEYDEKNASDEIGSIRRRPKTLADACYLAGNLSTKLSYLETDFNSRREEIGIIRAKIDLQAKELSELCAKLDLFVKTFTLVQKEPPHEPTP